MGCYDTKLSVWLPLECHNQEGVSAFMVYLEMLWIPTLHNEISESDLGNCLNPGERKEL